MDVDAVAAAIRFANAEAVAPHFRSLRAGEVHEKAAGEVVTVADRECERLLSGLLKDIADVPVVGEEAAAADPSLFSMLDAHRAWLVDPIDGTSNFAAGRADYAIMVAFLERGRPAAAWIFQPEFDRMATAVRGAGAFMNGVEVVPPSPSANSADWHGIVKARFLPDDVKRRVRSAMNDFGDELPPTGCAGTEYPDLISGVASFLLYWRTLPWDHAAGVLLAEEAGCRAIRPSGSPFSLLDDGAGLLVAPEAILERLRQSLFG